MKDLLTGAIGFAVLFGLAGVYALLRPRQSCSGNCGTCATAAGCDLPGRDEQTRPAE